MEKFFMRGKHPRAHTHTHKYTTRPHLPCCNIGAVCTHTAALLKFKVASNGWWKAKLKHAKQPAVSQPADCVHRARVQKETRKWDAGEIKKNENETTTITTAAAAIVHACSKTGKCEKWKAKLNKWARSTLPPPRLAFFIPCDCLVAPASRMPSLFNNCFFFYFYRQINEQEKQKFPVALVWVKWGGSKLERKRMSTAGNQLIYFMRFLMNDANLAGKQTPCNGVYWVNTVIWVGEGVVMNAHYTGVLS